MRDILNEIMKQSIGLFDTLKVTGSEEEVKIEAVNDNKLLLLKAILKPSPEFVGKFGLTNLGMLNGLLDFTSYKTEGASFTVKRDTKPKIGETVVAFHFKDANGTGARFATMNPELITAQATYGNIEWDVEVTPTKAKVGEFTQLTSLYKSVDETFRATIVDGNLIFSIGDSHEATHNASMVFATGVEGKLSKDIMKWNSALFLNILKVASVNGNVPKISISSRGPLGVSLTTPHGVYNYVLRTVDSEKKK